MRDLVREFTVDPKEKLVASQEKPNINGCPICGITNLRPLKNSRFYRRLRCDNCENIIRIDKETGELHVSRICG